MWRFFVAEKENSRKFLITRCCAVKKENTRKIFFSKKNKNKKYIINIEKENEQAKYACRTQLKKKDI